jgi:hypothetical protein
MSDQKTRQVTPHDVLKGLDAADARSMERLLEAIVKSMPTEQLLEVYLDLNGYNDIIEEVRFDEHGTYWDEVRLTK